MRVVLLLLLWTMGAVAQAAPKAEPWPRWEAHDESSTATIAHEAWDQLLASYLQTTADGINRFGYGRVSPADQLALKAYLERLQALPISRYNRAEQRAYWINLYNAKTIQLVIDRYPLASIRDIRLGGSFSAQIFGGPWTAKTLKVEGVALSLDDVEHRILRPIWRDPRTHYAVNCASLGCPNLAGKAYTPARMEVMLNEGAVAYVNHPRGAAVVGGKLVVSSIYKWFIADFGGDDAGILAHLQQYASPSKRTELGRFKSLSGSGERYDWALNDVR